MSDWHVLILGSEPDVILLHPPACQPASSRRCEALAAIEHEGVELLLAGMERKGSTEWFAVKVRFGQEAEGPYVDGSWYTDVSAHRLTIAESQEVRS